MKIAKLLKTPIGIRQSLSRLTMSIALTAGCVVIPRAWAGDITLNVVGPDGSPISGFRWTIQEDTTFAVNPANPAPLGQTLAGNFIKSHNPAARHTSGPNAGKTANGNTDAASAVIDNMADGRYYVSVLPYSNYAMGGGPVKLTGTSAELTVVVEKHPIPTAQISVFLFHDCYPLNGAPDLPEEEQGAGACVPDAVDFSKFSVIVEEPAGKYGIAGGPLLQDAFGNPIGTSYVKGCDASGQPDANPSTDFGCLDTNGAPIVAVLGDGTLSPNPDGTLLVKNLAPGKYGIIVTPPIGWTQTSTIEGTPVIDAWVKANEPAYFVEFGPPGPHVFIGFTQERNNLSNTVDGVASVSGTITNMHMSRPPSTGLFSGQLFPQCWIAVNENNGAVGLNVYAGPCDAASHFSIANVPPGNYELKVFDKPLDVVIATHAFTVDPVGGTCNGGQSCDFGEVPVFNWNNRLITYLFNDDNQNGFWDVNETNLGAESGPVNIRWPDGTIYQSFPTDFDGLAPFDEAFPWFHWMVAEVGFTNKKATGATIWVDAGGAPDPAFGKELAPQPQVCTSAQSSNPDDPDFGCTVGTPLINPNTGDNLSRTETGPVLLEAFQGFLGQTNLIHFGKSDYLVYDYSTLPPAFVGENGGISGVVLNTVTRAENDPRFAVAEEWEPGVPRVQVNLYADGDIQLPVLSDSTAFPNGIGDIDWNGDGIYQADDDIIDDVDDDGSVTLSDVDNYPLGWGAGGTKGLEDVDRNGNGLFDLGDAIAVVWTDSWDDNNPTGCQGQNNMTAAGISDDRCFDGMRNWNQVRPGVFDGGYAFTAYDAAHLNAVRPTALANIQAFYSYVNGAVSASVAETLQLGLLPGDYIVEASAPPGFKSLREHHKNVDLGDAYIPSPVALPPVCVGPAQEVPRYFALATKDGSGNANQLIAAFNPAEVLSPVYSGVDPLVNPPVTRPVCDQKKVPLQAAKNAAADFFLVSDVPFAGNITGTILNDLGNEFNPNSPNFGEKYAPPWMPVAFYDWNGKLVNRVYADEFGRYNALVPSTWNANLPQPSGMSPSVLAACMNDAGPIPDPANPSQLIVDPNHNPAFSQFCYTLQYMPGSTTYLDTPVVPIAAFASPVTYPVDCEQPTNTPMIKSVTRIDNSGPYVNPGDQIRIRSMGNVTVPNPNWDGTAATTKTIVRRYVFGPATGPSGGVRNVYLEDARGNRTKLNPPNTQWEPNVITATVPIGMAPGDYEVVVSKANGVETPVGVTLTVGPFAGAIHRVRQAPYPATPIQDAIDAAAPGDLILVGPGTYDELPIMWKPVKLQGWGAGVVFINGRQFPTEKIVKWRAKAEAMVNAGNIAMLPGQENLPGFQTQAGAVFPTEEGAVIFVAGKAPSDPASFANHPSRIDGFTIVGASTGGAIVVNGYNAGLSIGNNRLAANSGAFSGGVRVGHPTLVNNDPDLGLIYTDAMNDGVRLHHNAIIKNGSTGGGSGGISINTGADGYRIDHNWVCGNYSTGNGGGIAHLGLSDEGVIEQNKVLFNESFAQASAVHGGGLFIGGQPALQENGDGMLLSDGSGNVLVDANQIHGNLAGAGDGGGISIIETNGVDLAANPTDPTQWYKVRVYNNMITNNVAGLAGAVTLQNTLGAVIRNNTVANNDSTATTAQAFTPGVVDRSNPQPAGIVSRAHGVDIQGLLGSGFSNPRLIDNILWQNRSFFWLNYDDPATTTIETGLFPSSCWPNVCDPGLEPIPAYSLDLAVLGDPGSLTPVYSLLTDITDLGPSNVTGNPQFINPVLNQGWNGVNTQGFTVLQTAGAFDEGGNFIQVAFGPLSLVDWDGNPATNDQLFDYHLQPGSLSPAANADPVPRVSGRLSQDIDGDPRPLGSGIDLGADEAF